MGQAGAAGGGVLVALLALPTLFLLAALAGSLLPLNRAWEEPANGTTIYLSSNGIHVDIVMPAQAEGLDWSAVLPPSHVAEAPAEVARISPLTGERRVYLETPTWSDITLKTLWSALTGGERVLHVDQTDRPGFELRAIRLRPEEYRRLWAAMRADFDGKPRLIDHPGDGPDDAFYQSRGRASAVNTCNQWVADKLRLAGIRTSAWTPFAQGLLWRYRTVDAGLEDVAR